jgi:conjugative relaxase-like TrwC/TraI family protein
LGASFEIGGDRVFTMLTMKTQYKLTNAKEYFEQHLRVGDYYMEGNQVLGQWFGKGAEELGLSGVTQAEDFLRLCDNLHPQTGERLTARQNTVRLNEAGHKIANRRVFYDFTLSPPKAVSIAALVGCDQRIVEAHDEAVTAALKQLEIYAATRIRKQGQSSYRTTGNLVGAVFRHDTSRALDPHLHSHCILFNATKDSAENRWKALEAGEMVQAQKFVKNVYYHELVRSLNRFGYRIQNKPRGDFDIEGISQELIQRFSKRHDEIDQKTKELLEREPDKAGRNIKDIREHIAHKERARKIKDVGITKLQSIWKQQLSWKESYQLFRLNFREKSNIPIITANQAVQWAEDHLFDRRSVVHEHELWGHALEHARGQNFSLADIQTVTKERNYVRDKKIPDNITTREIITREWNIVCLAQDGIRRYAPLAPNVQTASTTLDTEQRHAVEHISSSRDFVTLFRGGAGTGKSYTLREIQSALKRSGHSVDVLTPQRQQVNDLMKDGFTDVQTVSAFLTRRSMPRRAVVLVDEAGQIGGEQMLQLLTVVKENDGRVILSGDTQQQGAVEASDALRAIEQYSGLQYAELTNIRRQNPDAAKNQTERRWLEQYRLAVSEARDGKLGASFDRLNQQGAIIACTLADQQQKLTEHFLEQVKANHSTVVVSQSWSEIHKVNDQVRNRLKAQRLIGVEDTNITSLERLDLTNAQKRDKRFYNPDSVLVFNRSASGFKPGDTGRLRGMANEHLLVECNNRIRPVSFEHLDKITVCQPKELALCTGDRLQLKANGKSENGRKLANGELVVVKEIQPDGRIALDDGRMLAKNYRQFMRGYAVTSYAAQGKTVDYVLFSDSTVKAATNAQQWYVTISRGRKGIRIFTADKFQLRQNIARSGNRTLALDIARPKGSFAHRLARIWKRSVTYVMDVQSSQCKSAKHQAETLRQLESLQTAEKIQPSETVRQPQTVRHEKKIFVKTQNPQTRSRSIGV